MTMARGSRGLTRWEIQPVDAPSFRVDLRRKGAAPPDLLEGAAEASDACKELDERESASRRPFRAQ